MITPAGALHACCSDPRRKVVLNIRCVKYSISEGIRGWIGTLMCRIDFKRLYSWAGNLLLRSVLLGSHKIRPTTCMRQLRLEITNRMSGRTLALCCVVVVQSDDKQD